LESSWKARSEVTISFLIQPVVGGENAFSVFSSNEMARAIVLTSCEETVKYPQ
jgi:hypothetical protein